MDAIRIYPVGQDHLTICCGETCFSIPAPTLAARGAKDKRQPVPAPPEEAPGDDQEDEEPWTFYGSLPFLQPRRSRTVILRSFRSLDAMKESIEKLTSQQMSGAGFLPDWLALKELEVVLRFAHKGPLHLHALEFLQTLTKNGCGVTLFVAPMDG